MKLASLKDGSRNGRLIVVSKDLATAVEAGTIAGSLLDAMENWRSCREKLQELYDSLNHGTADNAFALDVAALSAPLPRAPQWLDGSAYHSHGDLMEKVFGIDPPPEKHTVPLMYQGGSDSLLGPAEDSRLPSEDDGIDFEAEVAVVVEDVAMGTKAAEALDHIRLIMLANDVSLRNIIRNEVRTGFGFVQAKPSTCFTPVAVTPDELGVAWKDGRVHLRIQVYWNGELFGRPNAGAMGFGFHDLVAHAARTRLLRAGTIIGSGTVSNEDFREVGSACIAERRGIELLDRGQPKTEYMRFGDRVRIEMLDDDGNSIFGAIDQKVIQA